MWTISVLIPGINVYGQAPPDPVTKFIFMPGMKGFWLSFQVRSENQTWCDCPWLRYVHLRYSLFINTAAQSPQWYAWGPPNMQCRLCASCWNYWKKYGGLKTPTQLEGAARAGSVRLLYSLVNLYMYENKCWVILNYYIIILALFKVNLPESCLTVKESGPRGHMTRQEVQGLSPFTRNEGRAKLLAKNRQTFILQTTKLTRIARRVCEDILQPRRAARRPYASINANAVKAECMYKLIQSTHFIMNACDLINWDSISCMNMKY